MFTKYIHRLLEQAIYTKDESWYIVAEVPWYQWFFSQWRNYEEARNNLLDAIEWVITIKLAQGDATMKNILQKFITSHSRDYAKTDTAFA